MDKKMYDLVMIERKACYDLVKELASAEDEGEVSTALNNAAEAILNGALTQNGKLKADGLNKAIIGMANIWRNNSRYEVFVYDCKKIIKIFMERDGMSEDEAIEFIEFNVEGAYVGEETPVFVWPKE